MQLDLDCPVELLGYDLTRDERGVRGFVRLFNLANRAVTGFDAVITWQGDGYASDIPLQTGALNALPHEAFVLPIEAETAPGGHWSGLFFVRVDLDGSQPWKGNPKRLIEVDLPEKPVGRELEALRRVAGPDAAVRPLEARDYWVCSCGRANPIDSPGCDRCGRTKRECMQLTKQLAAAFKREKPEAITKKPGSDGGPPFHVTLQKRYLRQKSLLIRRTVTMLTAAVLISLIALAWTWLTDMQKRAKEIVPPTRVEATTATTAEQPLAQ
jgi:hypothetical protein